MIELKRFADVKLDKMLAIIDVDDILADFPSYWLDYLMERTGKPWNNKPGVYGLEDNLIKQFGDKAKIIVKDFYDEGLLINLKVLDGAVKFVKYLKNLGFELIALTGRPGFDNEQCLQDTIEWLANNDFAFDRVCFCKQKGEFAKYIEHQYFDLIILVEDSLPNILDMQKSGWIDHSFLKNKHYNIQLDTPTNCMRFKEFDELYSKIANLVINKRANIGVV